MGLRDLVRKKDRLASQDENLRAKTIDQLTSGPEFTFIRSDTISQEVIHPPSYGPGAPRQTAEDDRFLRTTGGGVASRLSLRPRSRSASASASSSTSAAGHADRDHFRRRLSQRLGLRRASPASENVPNDLPEIVVPAASAASAAGDGDADPEAREAREALEAQWERRATILATSRSGPPSPSAASAASPLLRSPLSPITPLSPMSTFAGGATPQNGTPNIGAGRFAPGMPGVCGGASVPTIRRDDDEEQREAEKKRRTDEAKRIDDKIQQAIKLHEDGQLEQSANLFAFLADPQGANNPLSQVLYGLALRHGWGCPPDPEAAVQYLSVAAANAAAVEKTALQAGIKKGGAAKGELVLAIFELANCFRHGWGTKADPVAAKQYYETAANLGDTDAMNEVGLCYLEGIGCKKDKSAAARYYRMAEKSGSKTLGNSWIWKDKYDAGYDGKRKQK